MQSRRRPDIGFSMELDNQLSRLLVDARFHPAMDRDIRAYPRLLELWMELSRNMISLMHHIIKASRLILKLSKEHSHAAYTNSSCSTTP